MSATVVPAPSLNDHAPKSPVVGFEPIEPEIVFESADVNPADVEITGVAILGISDVISTVPAVLTSPSVDVAVTER